MGSIVFMRAAAAFSFYPRGWPRGGPGSGRVVGRASNILRLKHDREIELEYKILYLDADPSQLGLKVIHADICTTDPSLALERQSAV